MSEVDAATEADLSVPASIACSKSDGRRKFSFSRRRPRSERESGKRLKR